MDRKAIMLILIATGAVFMMVGAVSAVPGNGATVVKEGAIYYEGELYGTVLTPTELPDKAPDHSFDVLYNFGGLQPSVSTAAPGDKNYNGGRWIVYAVTVNNEDVLPLTSAEAVLDAAEAGDVTISDEPVTRFVCPMIKLK